MMALSTPFDPTSLARQRSSTAITTSIAKILAKSRLVLVAVLVLFFAVPSARAGGGEHLWVTRANYHLSGDTKSSGGGLSLGYQYGLDDFWNLAAEVAWAIDATPRHFGRAGLSVLYHLDAFQWIPFLEVGAFAHLAGVSGVDPVWAFGLAVGGGVDYRPARGWSVGLYGRYHAILVGELPAQTELGLRVNLYF